VKNDVTATLTNVTIADNTAEPGGQSGSNYYYLGDATFTMVLVALSHAGDSCTGFGILTSQGGNLDDGASCGFTAAGDKQNQTNPGLAPLAIYNTHPANTGSTATQALLAGSPALDAGINGKCPSTDQRGVTRPLVSIVGGTKTCDIGAYESDTTYPTTTTSTTTTSTTTTTRATTTSTSTTTTTSTTTIIITTTTTRPTTTTTSTTTTTTRPTTTTTSTTTTTTRPTTTTTSTTTTTTRPTTTTTSTTSSTTTTTTPGLCGDVNGDGSVNIGDALIVAQHDVGLRDCGQGTFTHGELCDVNLDDSCNIGDALRMAQCDVGLISCTFNCTMPFTCQ
jgi:hypothetical protein